MSDKQVEQAVAVVVEHLHLACVATGGDQLAHREAPLPSLSARSVGASAAAKAKSVKSSLLMSAAETLRAAGTSAEADRARHVAERAVAAVLEELDRRPGPASEQVDVAAVVEVGGHDGHAGRSETRPGPPPP